MAELNRKPEPQEPVDDSKDFKTAQAFASSWNNLPSGSVYSFEQFSEWLSPLSQSDVQGKEVLELGCGNGSLLFHMAKYNPAKLVGVDLGDSVKSAQDNMSHLPTKNWEIVQHDLTTYQAQLFDIVYSIGVLHHLKDPKQGFDAVLRNTKPGGRFHCWVYASEGNLPVKLVVEPTRLIASKLPWWFTKYVLATCMVAPYFLYSKLLAKFKDFPLLKYFPLFEYSQWIAKREFHFYRHVAFDQLVTPQTVYIKQSQIEAWLEAAHAEETYVIFRNGNSWKFGGTKRT